MRIRISLMDDRRHRKHSLSGAVGVQASMLLLLLFLVGPVLASVPYTPSHLLYPPENDSPTAYLLRPSDSRSGAIEFLSVNVSGNVDPKDPEYTLLLGEAPFSSNHQTSAFAPVIDSHGIVKVYAGDCHSAGGQLWQFTPDTASSTGNGTWEKFDITEASNDALHGPNFLSAGFAYAPSNTTESSVFVFGGMCPDKSPGGSPWTAAANYSQSMILLEPPGATDDRSYQTSTTGNRAPPIPEAGFAVVPLEATYARTSSGDLLQQQDFLLVGGHTRTAFLNMSQLAVFSVPQNSWSIVSVSAARAIESTELAVRDTARVEPRSGHTAVLSPDGNSVVVFGGWVGNTSVPAEPQLAILELGADYAGYGEWTWHVPSMEDSGIADGTGIYGHGATMLPGGVMMVSGGYRISPQSSKRATVGTQSNSQVYLYNVTSGRWASSYTNPAAVSNQGTAESADSTTASGSSTARKAGLGAGIGLGVPAVAGGAFFIWYYCRRRRVRRARNKQIRQMALSAERDHFWGQDEPFMASSIRRPQVTEAGTNSDYPWQNNNRGYRSLPPNWRQAGDSMAERTRLLIDAPSPTKGSRSGINPRVYRPPGSFHEYKRSDATGDIHPIDERDEDEDQYAGAEVQDLNDPFRDSAAFSPRGVYTGGDRYPTAPGIAAVFATGLGITADRHSSTDKENRTSSNLSDSSNSSQSARQSRGALGQPSSLPSSGRESPEKAGSASTHSKEPRSRPDSVTLLQEKRYSSDSYSTAQTTLSQRQAEADHLLHDGPEPSSPTPLEVFSRPLTLPRPRASEWMGSVRRVLSVTRRRPPVDAGAVSSGIDRRSTVLGSPKGSASGSDQSSKFLPRRSVSASAELFRRKQGARDWGAAGHRSSRDTGSWESPLSASTRDDFTLDGLLPSDEDEHDWDVEGAAEGRRVQVTFTVPREKLRVVNATAGDMDGLSEKSVSRSNSDARHDE
ncbi:hypothetical protein BDV59DRAFT_107231 [Aspergillus ambiguus]|uniref:uncharacterized protein n=1 Tax=Aspergillus ambiguus TaxID=176160 RepID=UPI003CCDFB3B